MRALLTLHGGGGGSGRKRKPEKKKTRSAENEVRSFDEGPDLYLTLDQASPVRLPRHLPPFVYNEWKQSLTLEEELGRSAVLVDSIFHSCSADRESCIINLSGWGQIMKHRCCSNEDGAWQELSLGK